MNKYGALLAISILCLSADSPDVMTFLIWHTIWLAVFFYSVRKLEA